LKQRRAKDIGFGYYTRFIATVLMFDSTPLFCVMGDEFLTFETIYWKFLKQNSSYCRIRCA